ALGLLVLQYGRTTRTSGRVDTLRKRYLTILVVAVSVTVALGALSVADREQPAITLNAAYANGQITLTVESSAAGLSTTDQLAVQVLGLSKFNVIDKMTAEICEQVYAYS